MTNDRIRIQLGVDTIHYIADKPEKISYIK